MDITDSMIKNLCSDMVYKRGCEYFSEGRVYIKKRSDDKISAVVDGEELFNVFISFEDGKIKNELCTCQYYETLQSPCKHIIAVLKQRQAELKEGSVIANENDRIAENLCYEFSQNIERKRIHASFELFIKPNKEGDAEFEMSLSLPELGGRIQGLEHFLDCYLNYRDFKIDRTNTYSRRRMFFDECEDNIIKIMAEVYQTRSAGVDLYRKASSSTSFGSAAVRRMLPYLAKLDFKLVYDGMSIYGARVIKEDPDILIDVEAFGKDIVMSLSESGFAITQNGEWFLYNDIIYNTSASWRDYFMPIYRSLSEDNRTQITFRNNNAMLFASNVLPKLRNRHGVILNGIDDVIVNSNPEFVVVLDADAGDITASVSVKYGSMQFKLPNASFDNKEKIIVRDTEKERQLLSLFQSFRLSHSSYRLSGDKEIYDFLVNNYKLLKDSAQVIMTDRFKHLQIRDDFNLSVSAKYNKTTDYLEIGFESELTQDEIKNILSQIQKKNDFYRTKDGRFINLKNNSKSEILQLLETIGFGNDDFDFNLVPKTELLRIEATEGISRDESVDEYLKEIRNIQVKVPEDLQGELRPYQKDGLRWFEELSRLGMGGILADDMGLGKTLQTLCYIHSKKSDEPTLIVAPSTLVYNWQREIERFLPNAEYLIINGVKEVRQELIAKANEYEFVITSYPLLRRDISLYKDIVFSYCIIDEAQYIKNRKTMNAISVKKINARHKFALTGTPIENSVMELWSIFDFVMPGYLKTAREFQAKFDGEWENEEIASALRSIIKPFVLRRVKKDVLNELPDKIETTMYPELSNEQKGLYQAYALQARQEADGMVTGGKTMTLLTHLLRLRQICDHQALAGGSGKSGKLELLMELIRDSIDGGHRIIVFSQFVEMLKIIEKEINKEGYTYYCINGSVPQDERVKICEAFNEGDRDIVLVSLKSGGTGINLTGADTVIHYDPWWNPAVTDQATDRAYRIGQTRAVQVIKLATKGTVEEKILKLEQAKRGLAESIIQTNGVTLKNLSKEEILSLFDI